MFGWTPIWEAWAAIGTVGALFAVIHQTSQSARTARKKDLARVDALILLFEEAAEAVRRRERSSYQQAVYWYRNLNMIGGVKDVRAMVAGFPAHDLPTANVVVGFMRGRTALRYADESLERVFEEPMACVVDMSAQHRNLLSAIAILRRERRAMARPILTTLRRRFSRS